MCWETTAWKTISLDQQTDRAVRSLWHSSWSGAVGTGDQFLVIQVVCGSLLRGLLLSSYLFGLSLWSNKMEDQHQTISTIHIFVGAVCISVGAGKALYAVHECIPPGIQVQPVYCLNQETQSHSNLPSIDMLHSHDSNSLISCLLFILPWKPEYFPLTSSPFSSTQLYKAYFSFNFILFTLQNSYISKGEDQKDGLHGCTTGYCVVVMLRYPLLGPSFSLLNPLAALFGMKTAIYLLYSLKQYIVVGLLVSTKH